ncbi:MAG TPA: universal stress protein [Polyangiaceae bacterium]|nr:universal stress protein [Polyangiaceae bacterium]
MLWLAHDGSINADWLSHYAVHLGVGLPAKEVRAICVDDGSLEIAEFRKRSEFLRRECAGAGLTFSAESLPLRGTVSDTLRAHIPHGPETFVLCGARVHKRRFGFLEGTVSEQLLVAGCFNVIAIRIVHPGVLGNPRRLLVPVMGHPRGFRSGASFIRLLSDGLERVDVVTVLLPRRRGIGPPSVEVPQRQRAQASAYLERVKREIHDALGSKVQLDGSVLVALDPAKGIVLAAKQHRSQLICLGASERSLVERWVSGVPAEKVLEAAPCDVAIFRGVS